jgi:hypothetical protein
MYSVIEISGGIGKNIMATAVISGIKQKHPNRKVLVITAYPEVFLNNPEVYRVFKFGACPYFYNDYVKDKDTLFFCNEPYRSNGYLNQNKHLIESWCEELDVPCKIEPKLYITPLEAQVVKERINVNKPILVFQPFGGAVGQKFKYSWNRDIPPQQAQEIANRLSHEYHIVQPVNEQQIKLNRCEHVTLPIRELFVILSIADKIIGIDSCMQHAAKALNKSANVCWITNTPKVYGYDIHTNILPDPTKYKSNINDSIDGYFHEYDFSGSRLYDYPFVNENVFNIDEIIEKTLFTNTTKKDTDNFIDTYFDAVYLINMDKRKDRLKEMKQRLDTANIKNYKRVVGVAITDEEFKTMNKDAYKNFQFDKVSYIKGQLGCRQSHINCIKDAKKNNYDKILILEDDIYIDENINGKLKHVINEIKDNWDILYLGGDYRENNVTFQTSSYAINKHMFDALLNTIEDSGREIDYYYINHIQNKYKVLRIYPKLILQTKKDTDIQLTI